MLENINSEYILKRIAEYTSEGVNLKLIKYNKKLQNKMHLSIDNYKKYNQIEIEIIPIDELKKTDKYKFINRIEDKSLYHIYFNEEKEEIDRDYITSEDKIIKIRIIIDMEVTSLKELFYKCICIKEIKIINFNRINIIDMNKMFYGCTNLIKLDMLNFKTNNVTNISSMFNY